MDFFSIVKEEASTYGRTEINLIEKPKELSWHLTTPSETWTLKLSQLKAHYVISPDKTMQAGPIPKSWVYGSRPDPEAPAKFGAAYDKALSDGEIAYQKRKRK